jgi:transposase
MRDLVRYRKTLVQERAQEVNRVQKVLETANVKLSSVATDVLGKSGRDMLQAIIEGTTDAEVLANLARGLLRKKLPQLQEALDGRVQPHHRILLKHILAHVAFLEQELEQLQQEIEQRLPPFEEEMDLLMSIPGIQALSAAAILAEIGADMSRFPSAKHLASWAGVCPGNKQSGGKRRETAKRGKATRRCGLLLPKSCGSFPTPKTITLLLNTTGSLGGLARTKRLWLSLIACSSLSTMSYTPGSRIAI